MLNKLTHLLKSKSLAKNNNADKLAEIEILHAQLATATVPRPPEQIDVNNDRKAVWRIIVPGQQDRFMSEDSRSEGFIVHINPKQFYLHWLESGIHHTNENFICPLKKDMPADGKYHWAVDGFNHDISNPVPLAEPNCMIQGEHYRIAFTNGITRTLWLIVNDAQSFPMMVRGEESAYLLNHIAGLTNNPIHVSEIFKDTDNTPSLG